MMIVVLAFFSLTTTVIMSVIVSVTIMSMPIGNIFVQQCDAVETSNPVHSWFASWQVHNIFFPLSLSIKTSKNGKLILSFNHLSKIIKNWLLLVSSSIKNYGSLTLFFACCCCIIYCSNTNIWFSSFSSTVLWTILTILIFKSSFTVLKYQEEWIWFTELLDDDT